MGFRIMVSPNRGQAAYFPLLARQGSLYNLTLEEVQNQVGDVGKPSNSMNLDELLKGVVAAEGSEVTHDQKLSTQEQENTGGDGSMQRQPTLGETTLEDFLIRAGAISIGNQDGVLNPHSLVAIDPIVSTTQQADWLQLQMAAVQQQQMAVLGSSVPLAVSVFGNSAGDSGYSGNQLALSVPMPVVTVTSSDSQSTVERKQRFSDEMMEKTIERRQKRMIKNRESAARSRARKQAYTNHLENKVSELKKTNKRLNRQKEIQMLLPLDPPLEPKYQLRRTSSTSF
ncbi:PREDICTED: ABSCISIC ACID-INSENSITIVE 5-like protein 2 isoform X2 [Nelumbo nucifera]|uniref:ABSCISIC ACID-INSENSITIVE 5-like protein 2 isoform X2 n=1 Tax=Nelumbo nucifera TaxID=4432 RepID=A0A1U8A2A9_NELNU|nr:PREDICTED: ABSCISIC ACID-INSENSITIVE 5-like protein 2 isoform X2 [Nelumbo nucifera]